MKSNLASLAHKYLQAAPLAPFGLLLTFPQGPCLEESQGTKGSPEKGPPAGRATRGVSTAVGLQGPHTCPVIPAGGAKSLGPNYWLLAP